MRTKLLFLGIAALICAIFVARAQRPSPGDAEKYIKECEQQWAESTASGDATQVKEFVAEDFVGVGTDGSFYDKAKAISETTEGPKEFLSNHLDEVKVRFYGDSAVAQGSESWVRRTGSPRRGRYVWTDTWIRRNGKWQVVAAEDLIPPGPEK